MLCAEKDRVRSKPYIVNIFYDVIIRYGHKIVLFGVPVTWCAYNENGLVGESRHTRFWCLQRDCACNECVYGEYLFWDTVSGRLHLPLNNSWCGGTRMLILLVVGGLNWGVS